MIVLDRSRFAIDASESCCILLEWFKTSIQAITEKNEDTLWHHNDFISQTWDLISEERLSPFILAE